MKGDRRLPSIAPGIEIAEFDTELVVLVPNDRRAVHLDSGHAIVLDSCRRGHGADRLVADVVEATGDDAEAVREWVDGVLRELARLGILAAGSAADR